ncbi:hypothetical protein HUG15_00290 [Salicibibacter cibarius]|uniref:Uncharacterized protein n=1 Tax=Salicibibacter cibarius TaxID=2743000 RepID=A0A7T7C9U0_9BACI|nr:hypothetical protein [Salicibibacter cibarius]QQK74207.1 hypothetical protein HUG15_00290 [Salicibibacter cibarius]
MNKLHIEKVYTTMTAISPDEPDTPETGEGLLVDGRYMINFIEEPKKHVAVHELRACQYTPGGHVLYDILRDVGRQIVAERGLNLNADELRNLSGIELLIHLTQNQKGVV